jgi:hypothetical protein
MPLKYISSFLFLLLSLHATSQTTIQTNNFETPRPIFFGGGIVLGGSSSSFQLGLNPELVKTYNKLLILIELKKKKTENDIQEALYTAMSYGKTSQFYKKYPNHEGFNSLIRDVCIKLSLLENF